ncbi:methylated-DNA--protein-cysteine methyltransferase [Zymobacter palmae]|uniref:Methylated-DNA--protein-cysteine methyltransferase n=1 Tax=Zymobacter palmae TaxID=33074 RepID=A0A348HDZ1_9GAMM|nr:methylated-DNA--protein-cysteine methyltransferase [Zymobacter palmae]
MDAAMSLAGQFSGALHRCQYAALQPCREITVVEFIQPMHPNPRWRIVDIQQLTRMFARQRQHFGGPDKVFQHSLLNQLTRQACQHARIDHRFVEVINIVGASDGHPSKRVDQRLVDIDNLAEPINEGIHLLFARILVQHRSTVAEARIRQSIRNDAHHGTRAFEQAVPAVDGDTGHDRHGNCFGSRLSRNQLRHTDQIILRAHPDHHQIGFRQRFVARTRIQCIAFIEQCHAIGINIGDGNGLAVVGPFGDQCTNDRF